MNYSSYYISIFITTQHEVICTIPVSFFRAMARAAIQSDFVKYWKYATDDYILSWGRCTDKNLKNK